MHGLSLGRGNPFRSSEAREIVAQRNWNPEGRQVRTLFSRQTTVGGHHLVGRQEGELKKKSPYRENHDWKITVPETPPRRDGTHSSARRTYGIFVWGGGWPSCPAPRSRCYDNGRVKQCMARRGGEPGGKDGSREEPSRNRGRTSSSPQGFPHPWLQCQRKAITNIGRPGPQNRHFAQNPSMGP
jgi:hypothetical protein